VVQHNQTDLRGLAALSCKINELLSEPFGGAHEQRDSKKVESLDLFGLSRFLQRRGESDRAHSVCTQALAIGLPAEIRPKARRELALMAKRRGKHAQAAELWNEIVADPHDGVYACEQLAIYYERHAQDVRRATEFARLALAKLRRNRAISSRGPYADSQFARLEQKLLNRLARLGHRMKISGRSAKPLPLSCSQAESGAGRPDRLR
jgi:hypothetical protein